jgi:uncharacterized membrane protein YhaH (DUF805 family)
MSFTDAIATCFSKYATFTGRATRAEYWWFYLFNILLNWGASITGALVFGEGGDALSLLPTVALILPGIAVAVRRLHDTGRSGWNQLWALTIIGIIPLIIWFATEGDQGENAYGPPA